MSDLGEAFGSAAEGSLLARAVSERSSEPKRDASGHFAEDACLNCGTQLIGDHCHECGQKAHLHRTLGAFGHDLLHGALHFDGKTWRTLPKLALKPGELTRRYIDGERARFVSPLALFLFSIFLMFAVFQAAGVTAPVDLGGSSTDAARDLGEAKLEAREALEEAEAQLAALPDNAEAGVRAQSESEVERLTKTYDAIEVSQSYMDGREMGDRIVNSGVPLIDTLATKWRANPSLMLYKLQANSYKFSWLLIPFSVPFVWLLFAWKRQFRAYDHAIFVTYSLAFMSLMFIAASVLGLAGVDSGLLAIVVMIVAPIHLYKQLRGAYRLTRFQAFWRLMVLSLFIWIVIALFLNVLLVLGAF